VEVLDFTIRSKRVFFSRKNKNHNKTDNPGAHTHTHQTGVCVGGIGAVKIDSARQNGVGRVGGGGNIAFFMKKRKERE